MVIEYFAELRRKSLSHEQIGYAKCTTSRLVFISRADTAACRADRAGTARFLAREIERDVRRQNQRATGADLESFENGHTVRHQCVRFLNQRIERQHDAIADQAADAVAENAGRNQVQDSFLTADDQCMSGIVAALEAHHRRRTVGEKIDYFTLALVTPLGADDDDILAHRYPVIPGRLR